jgi:hypothetical protein
MGELNIIHTRDTPDTVPGTADTAFYQCPRSVLVYGTCTRVSRSASKAASVGLGVRAGTQYPCIALETAAATLTHSNQPQLLYYMCSRKERAAKSS